MLRLGPLSRVELDAAAFGKGADDRKVSAKLRVGNVWASVTRTLGGEARFEVKTENAVAGVRGTTFRVDASKDKSCVVKVYSGTVAVAAGPLPRPAARRRGRRRAAGAAAGGRAQGGHPRAVGADRHQHDAGEGGGRRQRRRAGAVRLADADEWETWNRERDAARK